jgi:hypothetical protein
MLNLMYVCMYVVYFEESSDVIADDYRVQYKTNKWITTV